MRRKGPRPAWLVLDAVAFVYLTAVALTYWTDRKASGYCFLAAGLALMNLRRELLRAA